MVSSIRQEDIELLKAAVKDYEPYPIDVYENMSCYDGESHEGDQRYAANIALQTLIDMGFTEDEVNPWKNKS